MMNIGQFTPGLPTISQPHKKSTVTPLPLAENRAQQDVDTNTHGSHRSKPAPVAANTSRPGDSPRNVVQNILAHIRDTLQAAPDAGARSQLLEQAREGITQGVAEARSQLQQAGLLDERANRRLNLIEHRLQKGLDRLNQRYQIEADQPDTNTPSAAQDITTMSLDVARLEQRSARVRIETLEGDVVTLDFNQTRASGFTARYANNGTETSYQAPAVRYVDASLSYQLQGDLNVEEQAAIDALIQSANQVANRFFGGNLQAAFAQTSQLGLDSATLSRFSMSLEQSSVYQAVTSYQSVASLADTATTGQQSTLADAAVAVDELKQLTDSARQQSRLANPRQFLPELLEGIASAKGFDLEALTDVVERLRHLIAELLPPAQSAEQTAEESQTEV